MFRYLTVFCFFTSVCLSQTIYFQTSQAPNGSLTVYSINPGTRGFDIVSMFNSLNTNKSAQAQIAMQTLNQGLIPNIQFITPMKYGTILVVGYLLPTNNIPSGNVGHHRIGKDLKSYGFTVVFVEQIVELVYSPNIIYTNNVFTSQVPSSLLPVFAVDLQQRAQDIEEVVRFMSTPPVRYSSTAFSPVSVQTTVNGPYYSSGSSNLSANVVNGLFSNGLIPQVISASTSDAPGGSLLKISFVPKVTGNFILGVNQTAQVVVGPDQITGIVFQQN